MAQWEHNKDLLLSGSERADLGECGSQDIIYTMIFCAQDCGSVKCTLVLVGLFFQT